MENRQNETQKKKKRFALTSAGETKKLVDNSVARNTKKFKKYAGTILVRSPLEINRRVLK